MLFFVPENDFVDVLNIVPHLHGSDFVDIDVLAAESILETAIFVVRIDDNFLLVEQKGYYKFLA